MAFGSFLINANQHLLDWGGAFPPNQFTLNSSCKMPMSAGSSRPSPIIILAALLHVVEAQISPCLLPSSPQQLIPFCQLSYHQVSYVCDPGGILSRTEAELIGRRLRPGVNLTNCVCPSRPCAQQDRRFGQLRAMALLLPNANLEDLRKCVRGRSGLKTGEDHRQLAQPDLASATGQFARLAIERLTGGSSGSHGHCEPDFFLLYIDRWDGNERTPFVARIFRRNLAHIKELSQVERVDSVSATAFEILSEQLGRGLLLAHPEWAHQPVEVPPPKLTASIVAQHDQLGAVPASLGPHGGRTEPIPSWAIYSALALLSLALGALLTAHLLGRRFSQVNQKKFSTASRMSTRSTRTEDMTPKGGSTRSTVTFGPGTSGGAGGSVGHLKSQMMFRQFSKGRSMHQNSLKAAQSQKI